MPGQFDVVIVGGGIAGLSASSVPGLYVVGNAGQGTQLAVVAAAEAAKAAHEMNAALVMEDHP